MHLVLSVAELTGPNLFVTLFDDRARAIEDSLASRADVGITSRKLSTILEAIEAHLENVGIELDFDALSVRLRCTTFALAQGFAGFST